MAPRHVCAVLFCALFIRLACAAPDASPRYQLSIRAGLALDEALQELARQTGIQLLFFSQITAGRSAQELSGKYTLAAAMTRLLERSDLTFRQVNEHTVEVRQAPPRSAARPLEAQQLTSTPASDDRMQEVHVIAKPEQLVATRVPTPLLEIPQSISVISSEQIRQQNSFELADVMENAPGIAVRRVSSLDQDAYSRAFAVTSYHVDGGAALTPSFNNATIYQGSPDMSEFDHVEVLRGSDALFSGNGNPGGAVSLVRKHPLPAPSFGMSATLGSWNNYRIELDATGPLTEGGALRARTDVVYATRDYFFERAHENRKKVFAVVEYDLTPTSMLTAGGSYQWDDALPLANTAPVIASGTTPNLPRSIGLTFDWAFYNTHIAEAYLQYRQQFADDWILKLNTAAGRTILNYGYGWFNGDISQLTPGVGSPSAQFTTRPNDFVLGTLDATLTGKLDWFGLREKVAIGADFTRIKGPLAAEDYFAFGPPLTNVLTFNPEAYPDPRGTTAPQVTADLREVLEQYGGFFSLQVDLTDAWSLSGGARVASDITRVGGNFSFFGLDFSGRSFELSSHHVVQPYGGLMYRLNHHLSWYASYADIYRTQDSPYLQPDGRLVGPQHGVTFESGIKGAWRDGALNGSLAVYRTEQRNVPIPAEGYTGGLVCCWTTGNGRSRGAELELDGKLAPGWLIGSGYTFNLYAVSNGVLGNGGIPITSTPRHLLKIWTSARLPGAFSRWTMGGSLRAQTTAPGSFYYACNHGLSQPCLANVAVYTRPYAVADLRAGFELDKHWQVALSVNNVLDKRYYLSQNTPSLSAWLGDPRNFMLRIDAKY